MIKKIGGFIKKQWPWFAGLLAVVLVFNSWFLDFGIRTDGDWGFFLKETADTLRRHYFSIWLSDSSFGRVLIDAGQAPSYAIYGWLSYYFDWSYGFIERLVHLWPAVIITLISSFTLTRYILKDRTAGLLGAITYTTNTYYLTLLTGHLTLAAAYAFAPFVVLFYLKAITRPRASSIVLCALALAVCSAYEPRFAYIMVLLLVLLAIFHFFLSFLKEEQASLLGILKIGFVYTAPVIIFGFLNLYWVLGLMMSGGASGGTVIESSLFGNEFFNISQSLTLFHPFWSGGEVEPFIMHEMPLYFWLIPIAAFAGIMVSQKNYKLLFFGILGLIGILLAKQSGEPFSSLYAWMFANFPGFNAYREASKFYMLIALSYSIMLPAVYVYCKRRWDKRWLNVSLFSILALLFLPNLLPIATNSVGATFAKRSMPEGYRELAEFLNQKDYYRTLWVPQKTRWSYVSANHPIVSSSKLLVDAWKDYDTSVQQWDNATSTDEINELIKQNYMPELLRKGSIKYVIVPMRDLQNEDDFYRSYNDDPAVFAENLSRQPYLKEVEQKFEGFRVFETKLTPRPYFSATSELYALDNLNSLPAKYDAFKQTAGQTGDFDFISNQQSKSYTHDMRDLFENIDPAHISGGAVKPQTLTTDKASSYYKDSMSADLSYKVRASKRGSEIVFRSEDRSWPNNTAAKPSEEIIDLAKGKNYFIKMGENIALVDKREEGIRLGSPKDEVALYAIESANLVPKPEYEESLWQKQVDDCSPYAGQAIIRMDSVVYGGKPVLSLFAKNHAACTGPSEIKIDGENEYLLRFKYRGQGSQFASYRLTYNNSAKTTITTDIPLSDELWRTYEKVIVPPKDASGVAIQLIGRPSNQASKEAHTIYGSLELATVSKAAVIQPQDQELEKITVTDQSPPYIDESINDQNLIPNGSFEQGLWQKKVSDCNNYDDNPAIRMSLSKQDVSEGKQALRLDAKRHIACTGPNPIKVEGGKTYQLSFDYQSNESKNIGYLIKFEGRKPDQITERIPVKGKKWQTFKKTIVIPPEVTKLNLSVFAYSDDEAPGRYFTNRYDNFSLRQIPDIAGRYYQITSPAIALAKPDNITYTSISNTKKQVIITNATKPFILTMSEQYHGGWKLLPANKQASGSYNYMPWKVLSALPGTEHLKLNGFQNGWYIDPAALCGAKKAICSRDNGAFSFTLSVQFNGQRWFNFGLIVSIVTGLGCFAVLAVSFARRKRGKPTGSTSDRKARPAFTIKRPGGTMIHAKTKLVDQIKKPRTIQTKTHDSKSAKQDT